MAIHRDVLLGIDDRVENGSVMKPRRDFGGRGWVPIKVTVGQLVSVTVCFNLFESFTKRHDDYLSAVTVSQLSEVELQSLVSMRTLR